MCSIYSPLPKTLNLSEHGLKKGGLLFFCIHQMTKIHLDAFCSCSQSLHWILPLSLGLLTYFLSFYLLCKRYISCTDSVVALAESFLRSQVVSVLLCIDNIGRCSLMTIAGAPGSIPYWCSPTSLSGPAQYVWICLSLCTLGVWPLMDFLLQGMVLPWSLGDTCVSADDGGRCRQHSDVMGWWCWVGEMVHLGGISWTSCHVPCFSPASSTTSLGALSLVCWGQLADWQSTSAYSVVPGDTREVIPMHCKGVRCRHPLERRKQLCEPCALCLTCKGLGVLCDRSASFFCLPEGKQTWGTNETCPSMAMPCWCTYPWQPLLGSVWVMQLLLEFHTGAPLAVATSATLG